MQKYLKWIHFFFLQSIEHRAELLAWICLNIVPSIILLFIWQSAYGRAQVLHGYNLSQILQYFLLGTLINSLTASHFEQFYSQQIREGKIDYVMTKPISFPTQILLRDIGGRLFYMCLSLPIFAGVYLLMMQTLHVSGVQVSVFSALEFLLLVVFGYLIEFSFALGTVFLTFWFEGAEGLEHFKWITITIFSGWMIPVAFMPLWLQKLVAFLPFQYMYAVPIAVLQNQAALQLRDIGFMVSALVVISGFLYYLWKRAVYQYSSAGG